MNYEQGQAIIVLTGVRLGFPMPSECIAKQILNNERVHTMFSANMDRDATQVHNLISEDENLVRLANKMSSDLIKEYKLIAQEESSKAVSMKRKIIGYAYASSDIAKATGHAKTGCHYLAIHDETSPMAVRDVVFSSQDKDEVKKAADQYDMPYGTYSIDLVTA